MESILTGLHLLTGLSCVLFVGCLVFYVLWRTQRNQSIRYRGLYTHYEQMVDFWVDQCKRSDAELNQLFLDYYTLDTYDAGLYKAYEKLYNKHLKRQYRRHHGLAKFRSPQAQIAAIQDNMFDRRMDAVDSGLPGTTYVGKRMLARKVNDMRTKRLGQNLLASVGS